MKQKIAREHDKNVLTQKHSFSFLLLTTQMYASKDIDVSLSYHFRLFIVKQMWNTEKEEKKKLFGNQSKWSIKISTNKIITNKRNNTVLKKSLQFIIYNEN